MEIELKSCATSYDDIAKCSKENSTDTKCQHTVIKAIRRLDWCTQFDNAW